MKQLNELIKAVYAGIIIGIAGTVYLNVATVSAIIGAILFSIGLIIICMQQYNLYTGKIGYTTKVKEIPTMLSYILGNAAGAFIVSWASPNLREAAVAAIQLKLSYSPILLLLKSIGCGFLMYIAVDIYKRKQSIWGIITCVPAFILAGFEHCIADMFYIFCAGTYSIQVLIFVLLVIIGNTIGAFFHRLVD